MWICRNLLFYSAICGRYLIDVQHHLLARFATVVLKSGHELDSVVPLTTRLAGPHPPEIQVEFVGMGGGGVGVGAELSTASSLGPAGGFDGSSGPRVPAFRLSSV